MAEVAANRISSDNQFIHYQTTSCNQETEYQRDVRKLVDLLSKLNPLAKEFFPSSYTPNRPKSDGRPSADALVFVGPTDYHNKSNVSNNGNNNNDSSSDGSSNNQPLNWKRTNGYNQGRNRMNDRVRRLEREESIRQTVYVSDIDHHVTQSEVKHFFEQVCGEVSRLRLLGDNLHSTRIAFVEFVQAESAILALNVSGMVLGSLPVRISPSKTPVRPRIP